MTNIEIIRSITFWAFALITVIFCVGTILANRIVYSLISAIVVFFSTAGLFFLLNAEYNAVVQIGIYGVAVPVLVAFAIMFTSYKTDKAVYLTSKPRLFFGLLSAGVLFLALIYIGIMSINMSYGHSFLLKKQVENVNLYQMFGAITDGFFNSYAFAFIMISVLLLLVVVGLSTFNLTKEKKNGR